MAKRKTRNGQKADVAGAGRLIMKCFLLEYLRDYANGVRAMQKGEVVTGLSKPSDSSWAYRVETVWG